VMRGIIGVAENRVKLHDCRAHEAIELSGGSMLQSRKACAAEVLAQKCFLFCLWPCSSGGSSSKVVAGTVGAP
jgi:hypothetical protein